MLFPTAVLAHPACTKPDAQALVGSEISDPPTVTIREFSFHGETLRWVGVSWGWPLEGGVFVVDCPGRKLAGTEIGHPFGLRNGPKIDGKPTLEVGYTPATSMDFEVRGIALLSFDGASISELWTHDTIEDDADTITPTHTEQAHKYSWRFRKDLAHIDVRGVLITDPKRWLKSTLPAEHFCFRRSAAKYVPCK